MINSGMLYVVATPIGNLKDITYRAVEILGSVEYLACEDTRKTGILIKELNLSKKPQFISYYEQNEDVRIPNILNLLINGKDIALVSDGGTPGISDPGYRLIRECLKNNIKVISVPGPSASISAIVASGLPTDRFLFLGFLPRKDGHKVTLLNKLKGSNAELEATVIIYEAPHRLVKTLESIKQTFGNIEITLMREQTKIYEERKCQKIDELIDIYTKTSPKGEFVILFNPKNF